MFQLSENLSSVSCIRPRRRGATLHHRQSANKLKKKTKVEVLDSNLVIADVTTPGLLEAAMEGMESVVLCTSAVPKVGTYADEVGRCRSGGAAEFTLPDRVLVVADYIRT